MQANPPPRRYCKSTEYAFNQKMTDDAFDAYMKRRLDEGQKQGYCTNCSRYYWEEFKSDHE